MGVAARQRAGGPRKGLDAWAVPETLAGPRKAKRRLAVVALSEADDMGAFAEARVSVEELAAAVEAGAWVADSAEHPNDGLAVVPEQVLGGSRA